LKTDKRYSIEFRGLKEGVHVFKFEIDNTFFEGIEYSEIHSGKLAAMITMAKRSNLLDMEITLKGFVTLTCDRCLDDYEQKIQYAGKLIAKFSGTFDDTDDEIIAIPESENSVDLKHYLYESISLALPYKRVHPAKSRCNLEMIEKLNILAPKHETETDPRWDKLKNIPSE
jgi:uncharacterized protein